VNEMGRAKDFSEDTKLKCLFWSARRCCVCDTACGLDIKVAQIDPNGGNDFENAIPVCYAADSPLLCYKTRDNGAESIKLTSAKCVYGNLFGQGDEAF
jgi:hypothetical protein